MIKVLPDIQNIFSTYFFHPFKQITKESPEFKAIEQFVILPYLRTSSHTSVNEARMEMYFQKTQNLERVPPTADALLLHIKRAIFKQGYGQHLCNLNRICHLPLTLVGKELIQTQTGNHNGFLKGRPVKSAESLWSVAAKLPAAGASAKVTICRAHFYVVAPVTKNCHIKQNNNLLLTNLFSLSFFYFLAFYLLT